MPTAPRLERYAAKRDFSRTPEPAPGKASRKAGSTLAYTMQKHAARRLHFDLRLEHDGALLSFAITKGPSLDPAQKRLAVRTEDHPLDYATFEGTIPEASYGAGTVMLWDRGTWRPHGDVDAGLAAGKLSFDLDGKRLKGAFALVRMKGRGRGENWLIIKERDADADREADPAAEALRSIATERTMDEIAAGAAHKAEKSAAGGPDRPAKPKRAKRTKANRTSEQDKEPDHTRLTHPDRILYPAASLTKQDLADYFRTVAEEMLPHVAGRPLSLVRCPEGRAKNCFFQKHHTSSLPAALKPVTVTEADGGKEPYLMLDDVEGLVACAQVGALELHVWGAPADRLDYPDRVVFDLDPAEDVDFGAVRKAARDVRARVEAAGLAAFPLMSGGKGIHVVVPLDGRTSWKDAKAFASALAKRLSADDPKRYLAKAAKAERKGRIFIDWLRNTRGATAIAPFSPRARADAPVATPIRWQELARFSAANAITVKTMPRRLGSLGTDPWAGFEDARRGITAKMIKDLG